MAKCPLCNSRKGKRQCQLAESVVCPLCCGTHRSEEKCTGCGYYQAPKREYTGLPIYALHEMDGNKLLEKRSFFIENAIATYDSSTDDALRDTDVITIIERLLDIYHFEDANPSIASEVIAKGVEQVKYAINRNMPDTNTAEVVKLLGTIKASVKRRAKYGRDYLMFIKEFTAMGSYL